VTPTTAAWLPGLGTLHFNLQSSLAGHPGLEYACTVAALTACEDGAGTCAATPLAYLRSLTTPVMSFASPNVAAGGTLEVACRASDSSGMRQDAVAYLSSLDRAGVACACAALPGGRTILPGPLPALTPAQLFPPAAAPGLALVTSQQATWRPNVGALAFTVTSSLDGVAGITRVVTFLALTRCTPEAPPPPPAGAVCGWTFLLDISPATASFTIASPNIAGGGTLEATVVVTAPDGRVAASAFPLQLPAAGQPVCVCPADQRASVAVTQLAGGETDAPAPSPAAGFIPV
jgi:hypothetical protein